MVLQTKTIFDCLFQCMNDYTIDSRGDVGAWYVFFYI